MLQYTFTRFIFFFCMKKILLSCGLLIGVAGAASAQETRFGIKAGVGLADVRGDDAGTTKKLFGFQAGFMADVSLGEHFAFHPELLYSQKGAKVDQYDSYTTSVGTYTLTQTGQVRLGYLDLPLLLRLKAAGVFLEVGPQVGLLLSQQADATTTTTVTYTGAGGSVVNTDSQSSNSTDGTRKLDVGYVVGLGYALPQGFEVGVRYNGGITSLEDSSNNAAKVFNSVFQLQVGYLFGGK